MRSPAPTSRRRRGLVGTLAVTLLASPLAISLAGTAAAASSTIVINEAYINGGSSGATYTNRFVELRNLTNADIDFAVAPMSLQYRAPGSTGNSTNVVALTGVIPAGGYYTILGASNGANGAAVPGVDQTATGFNPGNAGGTITLASGTAAVDPASVSAPVVDKLGYGTSNTPETAAASGNTVTLSIQRIAADNDNNSTEFTAQAPTPDANNVVAPAGLDAVSPGNKSGVVGAPITGFNLNATGGTGPYTWTATGLPPGVDVATDGAVSGTPTTAGTYTVTATATDSAAPTKATDTVTFTFTDLASLPPRSRSPRSRARAPRRRSTARRSPLVASSPPRTRRAASTASTSRRPAPTRRRTPRTRSSSTAGPPASPPTRLSATPSR